MPEPEGQVLEPPTLKSEETDTQSQKCQKKKAAKTAENELEIEKNIILGAPIEHEVPFSKAQKTKQTKVESKPVSEAVVVEAEPVLSKSQKKKQAKAAADSMLQASPSAPPCA